MHLYYNLIEPWLLIRNRHSQFLFLFFYLFAAEREKLAYDDFLKHPLMDIERILIASVDKIVFRPLLVGGCIGIKKKREDLDFKCWIIYIREDNNLHYQLETFTHEILHIKLFEFGINWHPDEQKLDKIAVQVADAHPKPIKKLLFEYSSPQLYGQRSFPAWSS